MDYMTVEEKLAAIAGNQQKVYDAGYAEGHALSFREAKHTFENDYFMVKMKSDGGSGSPFVTRCLVKAQGTNDSGLRCATLANVEEDLGLKGYRDEDGYYHTNIMTDDIIRHKWLRLNNDHAHGSDIVQEGDELAWDLWEGPTT